MPNTDVKLLNFRALIYFDKAHNFYVGHCLETGTVVTADDGETASDMMREVLEDEANYAIMHGSFANLYSSPAPIEIWTRWYEAAKVKEPIPVQLRITATELNLKEAEVPGEVEMACA
jgi:hypothetical protein